MSESQSTSPGVRLGERIFAAIASVPEPQRGQILADLSDAIGEFLQADAAERRESHQNRSEPVESVGFLTVFPAELLDDSDDEPVAEFETFEASLIEPLP